MAAKVKAESKGVPLTYGEFFAFDRSNHPRQGQGGVPRDWGSALDACGDLKVDLPMPFLALPRGLGHPSRQRINAAVELIRTLSQDYDYLDLFMKDIYAVFGGDKITGVQRLSDYQAIREAFESGLLGSSKVKFPRGGNSANVTANKKCYSLTQGCTDGLDTDYCATDEYGNPTPSTDICSN